MYLPFIIIDGLLVNFVLLWSTLKITGIYDCEEKFKFKYDKNLYRVRAVENENKQRKMYIVSMCQINTEHVHVTLKWMDFLKMLSAKY